MERKVDFRLSDFRGVFETDDGGRRIIEKAGLISVKNALAKECWPESWLEEETSLFPREFIPIEDELEAAPDGTRILAFDSDINYDEQEKEDEEENLPDGTEFKLDSQLVARREEMSDPDNIKKWIDERYGNALKPLQTAASSDIFSPHIFIEYTLPEFIPLRTCEHERQKIPMISEKISRDRIRAWGHKPPAKKPWFKTKRYLPKSIAILNAMTRI